LRSARVSIVTRTVLLCAAIATIAVGLAGVVAYPLIRSSSQNTVRSDLRILADLTASGLEREDPAHPDRFIPRGLMDTLRAKSIEGYLVSPGGELPPNITSEEIAESLDSDQEVVRQPSGDVLVESRALSNGMTLVLTQPYSVVGGQAFEVLRRFASALIIGLLVAIPIGYWAARRLTRPLREARDAANQMASGERDVTVIPSGPTEIADIGVALNHLNHALVISEGRQREFLLSVSHELRTPLTAVKGYAEALADGVIPPEDIERTGSVVSAEAARLDRLVSDLLDLARLGAVDFPVTPIDVDLCEIAEEAAMVCADRVTREGLQWVAEVPSDEVHVRTDPIRVRQIIDNLAENALRVSPRGSMIVLAIRREPGFAVVEIRDSGPGLTPDDLSVAFEPGVLHERYRGERPVGTGLGLALVGRLARGLGGEAEAGAAPEGGARFTVRLPA